MNLTEPDKRIKALDGNWLNCQKSNLVFEANIPFPDTSKCRICGSEFPTASFRVCRNKDTGQYYPRYECNGCAQKIEANRQRDPAAMRATNIKKKFGITVDQWNRIFEKQGRRCKICLGTKHRSNGWNTDHDHATGKIRGILCGACNTMLGHAHESITTLKNAIKYLRFHSSA